MIMNRKKPGQIYPTSKNVGYLEARQIAKAKNAFLPSNVLHDNILLRSDKWKGIAKLGGYPMWADEISAHPAKGGGFLRGVDIVDKETGWILPFSEANSSADSEFTRRKRVGLIVTPEEVSVEKGKVIVHPKSIIVIYNRVEIFGVAGQVDERTRTPINIGLGTFASQLAKNIDPLPSEDLRWQYCFEGEAVRAIKRYMHDFRRGIFEISWRALDIAHAGLVYPISSD